MTSILLRSPSVRSSPLVRGLVAGAGALVLALFVSTKAADVSPVAPLGAALFLVLPTWLFVNQRIEQSLAVLIVYLGVLDGYLKLKLGAEVMALGRDFLLYAIAGGMLARTILKHKPVRVPPLTGWLVAWTAVVLVQLLNPSNGSWLHSFASLRQDLEFLPLFFIAYAVMTSVKRLRAFLALLLFVAAINGGVGLVQSGLSPEQLSGWGPGYAALIKGVGGAAPRTATGADGEARVRPPGLGSDMGFAGILGAVALPGGIALMLTRRRGSPVVWIYLPMIVLAVTGVITSQSRSTMITAIVAGLVFLAFIVRSLRIRHVLGGVVVTGLLVFAALTVVTNEDDTTLFRYRSIAPSNVVQTTLDSRPGALGQMAEYLQTYPVGAGIGSVGPAVGTIGADPQNTPSAESQITYLIAEVGIAGLLVFLAFYARLLSVVVKRLRKLKEREHRVLLAALAAPLFAFVANWVVGVNTVSTPNSAYLWFAAGVLSLWLLTNPSRRSPPADAR